METSIDFLRAKRAKELEKYSLLHSIRIISFLVLAFYCIIMLAFFSYSLYLTSASSKVSQKMEAKKIRLAELKKTESLQILTKQRLSALSYFFSGNNSPLAEYLLFFDELKPEGIEYSNLSFSQEGKISLNGTSRNAVFLADFVDKLSAKENTDKYFSAIDLSSASRKETGAYNFTLNFQLENQ